MKNHEMQQQLVQLGNNAHALATQMMGNVDGAAAELPAVGTASVIELE